MKTRPPQWSEIAAGLAQYKATPTTDSKAFWQQFEAQRHLYPQPPATAGVRSASWLWTISSIGATALVALFASVWLLLVQPTPAQAGFAIHSYVVASEHSSIMLWQDSTSQITFLWINDLELEEETEEENHKP